MKGEVFILGEQEAKGNQEWEKREDREREKREDRDRERKKRKRQKGFEKLFEEESLKEIKKQFHMDK